MNRCGLFVASLVAGFSAFAATLDPVAAPSQSGEVSKTSVQVVLLSDGETWVSIANRMPPQKFTSHKIALPPGNYEVVGRRKGYRDVGYMLQLKSGAGSKQLSVICTERGPV
jgi:hypothetical protein